MEHGISLFEQQAENESALTSFKKKEGQLLMSLIISAENLSVKLDQQVLSIVDQVNL